MNQTSARDQGYGGTGAAPGFPWLRFHLLGSDRLSREGYFSIERKHKGASSWPPVSVWGELCAECGVCLRAATHPTTGDLSSLLSISIFAKSFYLPSVIGTGCRAVYLVGRHSSTTLYSQLSMDIFT